LKEGRFEPETVKLFVGALRPGMVVLDVGAYLGYYTFLAARQVGEKGKVYAFEPDPSSYRFLEHNIHLNGYSNIVAVSKAASSRGRIRNLYLNTSDPTMTSLLPRKGWEKTVLVECTSLDEFLGDQKVNVIKLDVEGAELSALRGVAKIIAKSTCVRVFVELNPISLSEGGFSSEVLLEEVEKLGFHSVVRVDEHRSPCGKLELCNLYCC